MPLIKLDAINSTNSFLKELIGNQQVENFTVVTAKHQTNGRGQMGATWMSEPSKNLMFSVFVDTSGYPLEFPFYLSIATSLALRKALFELTIPKLMVKWPNDILSHNSKICGVLIENVIKNGNVNASIIGIGINVNQTEFKGLPKASSLKLITGRIYDLDEVLDAVLSNLKHYFSLLKQGAFGALKTEYQSYLFRKNKPSTFKDREGNLFSGYIQDVLETGDLQVLLEDDVTKAFALKDIELLY
ncbi:biotin--[acetyl-CoA-carboxylase] ligase [Hyunsoonleella sp. SJ7]|uniref:Biotin--[acetyl-CoA-carboxylase] ligase n=1 Tax=Hyunsoonleella aquatilis TaxID=2762758 RepID=A0A923HF89_9FLAO|nr:biotin--[acetyl-CoA-carboxylase] ligase [Hyunsoonleella aquatilis]MBC3757367.1 biotin--[acetyl-CoA-carboxylase] ligase [Hyunsoonleella aquatilis]